MTSINSQNYFPLITLHDSFITSIEIELILVKNNSCKVVISLTLMTKKDLSNKIK